MPCADFVNLMACLCSANDLCKESRRQTINADDVLKAIEEIEFPEFAEPLRASLDGTEFPYVLLYLLSFALDLFVRGSVFCD